MAAVRTADESACSICKARLRGLLSPRLCLLSSKMVGCVVREGGLRRDSLTFQCPGSLDGLLLLFENWRVEAEGAAVFCDGPHDVVGDATGHRGLYFNRHVDVGTDQ